MIICGNISRQLFLCLGRVLCAGVGVRVSVSVGVRFGVSVGKTTTATNSMERRNDDEDENNMNNERWQGGRWERIDAYWWVHDDEDRSTDKGCANDNHTQAFIIMIVSYFLRTLRTFS